MASPQRGFMGKAAHLPSSALWYLLRWTVGAHAAYDEKTKDPIARTDKKATSRGLLSAVLESVKAAGVWLADSVYKHETAVSVAFWLSALLAGAAALTVFLWPAALTAVAAVSIGGFTLASVFGSSTAGIVGGVAVVTAAATSTVTYLVAGMVNLVNWARNKTPAEEVPPVAENTESTEQNTTGSSSSATTEPGATATATSTTTAATTVATTATTTATTTTATTAATTATTATSSAAALGKLGGSTTSATSSNVVDLKAPVHVVSKAPVAPTAPEAPTSSMSMGA